MASPRRAGQIYDDGIRARRAPLRRDAIRLKHNEATRERIPNAAARLFREHGIEAVGLAKIMVDVDLAAGTFYTHFKSKEALLRETLLRSLQARNAEIELELHMGDLELAVRAYLSPEHRDAPGAGCPAAALAPRLRSIPARPDKPWPPSSSRASTSWRSACRRVRREGHVMNRERNIVMLRATARRQPCPPQGSSRPLDPSSRANRHAHLASSAQVAREPGSRVLLTLCK